MWYGVCDRTSSTKLKNCYYDGPPKLLESQNIAELRKWCPHLVSDKTETFTCCDTDQVNNNIFIQSDELVLIISFLNKQINDLIRGVKQAASILKRCPSCFTNFLQNICEFTCSPHQSTFIDVIETRFNKKSNSKILFKFFE